MAQPEAVFAWRANRSVSRLEFLQSAELVATALPPLDFFINRCASRYSFAVTLAATAMRGATCLLPSSAGEGAINMLRQRYPRSALLDDGAISKLLCEMVRPLASPPVTRDLCLPEQVIAIAFTSGSTGEPRACPKSWGFLASSANFCRERVGGGRAFNVVATVPAQHMFGLEASVCTVLAAGWAMFDGPCFFPAQIVAALETVPRPRLLVTSPFHLRHLLASNLELPAIDVILSATAPLPLELAREAELRCGGVVQEIYGCSEAGSLGTRRTAHEAQFLPYPGVQFESCRSETGERCSVTAPHLGEKITLADQLEVSADGRFRLLGRDTDMIKVAGRRASLSEITRILVSLAGVQDAAVFVPQQGDEARPAALVVAPGQTESQLRAALAPLLDPIFIPRPLRIVPNLPRNALGKLPRAELLALLGSRG